ncbi:transferrin binding protein [Volucribacter psittacicida]|uniref:Transferrin binding protein n=1 Tax=Volucribacter psittacicida TaxID=203482 RepID=A0A4R1FRD0_9PAST|nr:transferrin-binding protein-like solute binding protein [Volucribacter psittacicida]TCJ96094.1 transferrin binding protein [Volucribacter psittacicida]
MKFKKCYLSYCCSMLMVGCAFGGGSTEPEVVPSATYVEEGTTENKTVYKTPVISVQEDNAEVGYSINAPIPKNLLIEASDLFGKIHTLNPDAQYKEESENKASLKIHFMTVQEVNGTKQYVKEEREIPLSFDGDKWNYLSSSQKFEGGKAVYYYDESDPNVIIKLFSNDNTLLGLVRIKDNQFQNASLISQDDYYVTSIFYKGFDKTPADNIPDNGTFTYEGHWLFAHQLNGSDDLNPYGGTGEELTGEDKVTFIVDFSQKTLSGKLKSSSGVNIDYDVTADIKGNSFYGTAKGSYSDKENNLGQFVNGKSNSEAIVFGSFYGNQAEELAGRAQAKDNSWAGVFNAKRDNTDISELYSAGILSFEQEKLQEMKKVDFNGDIHQLVIDGTVIDLNTQGGSCCNEMQFAQYGLYSQQINNETSGGYFVQGKPTPNYQIPTTGSAEYAGYWYGSGTGVGNVTANKFDARFVADWENKKLTGNLYTKDQLVSSENPAVKFDANIQNNHFSGTANINWQIDSSKEGLGNDQAITGQAAVQGMFYGPSANELGGHFLSEDKNVGGVFGGKQVEN